MSMLMYEDGKGFISFGKYILSESILPKRVDYGNNTSLDNRKWTKYTGISSKLYSTFCKVNNRYYIISIDDDGEISFATSKDFDTDRVNDTGYVATTFTVDRVDTRNILTVFGNIIYVLLEGLKIVPVNTIKFSAADPSLGTAYAFMVKNKPLTEKINELGYEYVGIIDDYFTYKRK